jgi:hypothetical protein
MSEENYRRYTVATFCTIVIQNAVGDTSTADCTNCEQILYIYAWLMSDVQSTGPSQIVLIFNSQLVDCGLIDRAFVKVR